MRSAVGRLAAQGGLALLGFVAAVGAGCGGSSGGGAGAASSAARTTGGVTPSSTASTTSGSTTTPGSTVQQGFAGVWDVSGVDSTGRAYTGTAAVAATGSASYSVQKLVTFQPKLPSGEELAWAWNAAAAEESGGLRVEATLRRAHIMKTAGSSTRTLQDGMPLFVTGLFQGAKGGAVGPVSIGTAMVATFDTSSGPGVRETWTRSTTAAPAFPQVNAQLLQGNPPPSASERTLLDNTFGPYRKLPVFAPYVSQPGFQSGVHQVWWDSTGLDFYRQHGPGVVLVLDKVADEIGVAEETRRAHAFSRRLHEKAALFDDEMTHVCSDANGMVVAIDNTVTPAARSFAQSPVLYTGTWALSQYYRYQSTHDQEAFDNLVRAATGAVVCVDISTDKTQFARAIDFVVNAQPGQIGPPNGKYSWVAGTGAYANLMWMYGGNNDMLHGIEIAFAAAMEALPPGHPLLPQIGAQACSLLDHCTLAQSGTHEVFLSGVAATLTNDPARQSAHTTALGFKNILDKTYMQAGGTFLEWQGIADWSGHNLGALTHFSVKLLGGASPSADEQSWRDAGDAGLRAGFASSGAFRHGIVATIAAGAQAPGASDTIATVLTEIPFPKSIGNVTIDYTISEGWCYSPNPSMPWKNDWMQGGRIQGLMSMPYFYRPVDQDFWNRSPLVVSGGPDLLEEPGMDYLLSYWYQRAIGTLGPND